MVKIRKMLLDLENFRRDLDFLFKSTHIILPDYKLSSQNVIKMVLLPLHHKNNLGCTFVVFPLMTYVTKHQGI